MPKRFLILAALAAAAPAQDTPPARPGFLGVRIAPLDAENRAAFGIAEAVTEGVIIVEALPDTAAAKAGLQPGDVLVQLAGAPVRTTDELIAVVRARAPGDEIAYLVRRGEGRIDGRLKLGTPPAPPPDKIEERIDRVQREIEELDRKLRKGPRTVSDWVRAEERRLEEARARGDRAAVERSEIRLELLKEMEVEGVRGQEERLDRIEKKLDGILKRLGER